jgi:hypothetical protein
VVVTSTDAAPAGWGVPVAGAAPAAADADWLELADIPPPPHAAANAARATAARPSPAVEENVPLPRTFMEFLPS